MYQQASSTPDSSTSHPKIFAHSSVRSVTVIPSAGTSISCKQYPYFRLVVELDPSGRNAQLRRPAAIDLARRLVPLTLSRPAAGPSMVNVATGSSCGGAEAHRTEPKQLSLFVAQGQLELAAITKSALEQLHLDAAPHRLSWMSLLARIFAIDVLACQRCGGRLAATAAVPGREEIALLLHGARGPPRPAPPGQLELLH